MGGRKVLLLVPSVLLARGLESVFSDLGEFRSAGILADLSHGNENRIRSIGADVVIVDPVVFGYEQRGSVRNYLSSITDAPVVALISTSTDEESLRQYDETISLYDDPPTIIRKLRSALESRSEAPRTEGEELSSREKEILVCVAKGMLNKEIADLYSISIYTVITHRKNITRKTGIKTVAGLTVYALLNNLIDMSSME